MTDAESREVLLTDRFSFCHPSLWFPRARLYADRLELTGWRLWRRYRRCISLYHVLQVDATSADRLLLWMANGQTLRLCIDDAQQWQEAIASQLEDLRYHPHPNH